MRTSLGFFVLLLSLFQGLLLFAQHKAAVVNHAPVVKSVMERNHYSPRTADEAYYTDVLNGFINSLDEEHLYFTAADISRLRAHKQLLQEELGGRHHRFTDTLLPLYKARLAKADSLIVSILQTPFQFTAPESIVFASDTGSFAADEKEYRSRWLKWLKYKTLYRLTNILLYDSTATSASVLKQEPQVRELVRKTEQRKIKKLLEHPHGFAAHVAYLLSNAVAHAYDPHSDFFPLSEKENFVGAVSGVSYSFGLYLDENDKEEIEIVHIQPGSPSWKCGELNKSDVLLSVKWEGKSPIDLTGADMQEVNALFAELNHERLSLTVRKANGLQKTVMLRKEKMREEEEFVKSFVLRGEKNIGYIQLPGFYSEWETNSGSSCANDVAKEILKLKKENIDGLILDLSDNGGGSMMEAMQLSGIFVEEGTLGFSKERTGKPVSLKDPNRGTIYDGPLLVMVNGSSASASEFVAGALQDYNRAIIAGSPTFGKATMQVVMPADSNINLETAMPSALDRKDGDFVKVTIGKLFRASGKSNQLKGVQPDVPLPDIAEKISYREASLKNALNTDTVKRSSYFTPLAPLPVEDLKNKSAARVSTRKGFQWIEKSKTLLAEMYMREGHPFPLQFDAYYTAKKEYNTQWHRFVDAMEQDTLVVYKAGNHADDKKQLEVDTYQAEINADLLKDITYDLYIQESFFILVDYIKSIK